MAIWATAAALMLLLSLTPAFAKTQTHIVKIRIINAKTNQPIHDEHLNVALRVDQIGSVAMPTDKNGNYQPDQMVIYDAGRNTKTNVVSRWSAMLTVRYTF